MGGAAWWKYKTASADGISRDFPAIEWVPSNESRRVTLPSECVSHSVPV